MKLSDVEYQGDNAKAIFYYIADHRVDFRELIKVLAREFRIRVEMKQIGLRYEAGLVGGIGSCGRELCCSTWLTEFKTVSTSAARYQNISLNPMKISGLCGRLKCCLNFELETYLDALDDIPRVESIETAKGKAYLQKTDIFKKKMWFSYPGETTWYPIHIKEVKRIMALNAKGEKPEGVLTRIASLEASAASASLDFVDVVGTNVPEPEPRRRGGKGGGRGRGQGRDQGRGRDPRSKNRDGGDKRRQGRSQSKPQGNTSGKGTEGKKQDGRGADNRSKDGKRTDNRRPDNRRPDNRRQDGRKPQSKRSDGNKPQEKGESNASAPKGGKKNVRRGPQRNFRRGKGPDKGNPQGPKNEPPTA